MESNWDLDLPLGLSRGEQENTQSDRIGHNNNHSMANHHQQPMNNSDKSHDRSNRPGGVRLSGGVHSRPGSAKSEHPNPATASNHTDNSNGNNTSTNNNNTIHSSTQPAGLIEKSISNSSNLIVHSGGGGSGADVTRTSSLERGRPEKPAHTVLRSLGPLAVENITPQQINILVGTLFRTFLSYIYHTCSHTFTHMHSYMHITPSASTHLNEYAQLYVKFYCRVSK